MTAQRESRRSNCAWMADSVAPAPVRMWRFLAMIRQHWRGYGLSIVLATLFLLGLVLQT
jgi:hypothetical protein